VRRETRLLPARAAGNGAALELEMSRLESAGSLGIAVARSRRLLMPVSGSRLGPTRGLRRRRRASSRCAFGDPRHRGASALGAAEPKPKSCASGRRIGDTVLWFLAAISASASDCRLFSGIVAGYLAEHAGEAAERGRRPRSDRRLQQVRADSGARRARHLLEPPRPTTSRFWPPLRDRAHTLCTAAEPVAQAFSTGGRLNQFRSCLEPSEAVKSLRR